MKYFVFVAVCVVACLGAMDKPTWEVEKLVTRMANQRRADDMLYIKKFKQICQKPSSAITAGDKQDLVEMAGRYKSFCVLEEVCKSPLFKDKEIQLIKDLMLHSAVTVISYGSGNSKRRERVLKNVQVLLENGAGQNERDFESLLGGCCYHVFHCCGITKKDFEVGSITQNTCLQLVGLFAKHITHETFRRRVDNELITIPDVEWAKKLAKAALSNGLSTPVITTILNK